MLDRIERLVQWSDLSPGYATTEDFLAASTLDENGKIQRSWEMVDLGAQCWKKAAQIYLLCRLSRCLNSISLGQIPTLSNCETPNMFDHRYPRTHSVVLQKLDLLLELLLRMPCSGSLFTSMTPLFPCFLMGLLSVKNSRHREFVLNWFGTVMNANQCRSVSFPSNRRRTGCRASLFKYHD